MIQDDPIFSGWGLIIHLCDMIYVEELKFTLF